MHEGGSSYFSFTGRAFGDAGQFKIIKTVEEGAVVEMSAHEVEAELEGEWGRVGWDGLSRGRHARGGFLCNCGKMPHSCACKNGLALPFRRAAASHLGGMGLRARPQPKP